MATECVAPKPGEQVVQHLLADPPAASGRQLEPIAIAGEVAGPLELLREFVERIEVTRGIVSEQTGDAVAVHLGKVARTADPVELLLERVERLEVGHLGERPLEPQWLVAAEPVALAESTGQQLVHRRGQLGEVPAQPVVPEQGIHRVLELGPLLGRHGLEERLERGHPLGELLDDVVQALGAGEERAVLGHELRDVRIPAGDPFLEELVEVADHLPVRGEVLRRGVPDRVRHPADELVEDLLAKLLHEGLEPLAGARLHEVVLLEAPDPPTDVRWQLVELVEPFRRGIAKHRPEGGVGGLLGGGR